MRTLNGSLYGEHLEPLLSSPTLPGRVPSSLPTEALLEFWQLNWYLPVRRLEESPQEKLRTNRSIGSVHVGSG